MARGDAPEVLEAAERVLDPMAFAIPILVVSNLLFPVASTGNDWRYAKAAEAFAERIGVIAFIGDQPLCAIQVADQKLNGPHVADIARGESDSERATYYVGEDVEFACLAAPRRADALRFRPPLPPKAARCAFT